MTATPIDATHETLKEQFNTVNRILSNTNLKLNSKMGELDVLVYYLNSILSSMSQGLLFINLDGNVTTCNASAENLLEVKAAKILFQPFAAHFPDDLFGFSMQNALATRQVSKKMLTYLKTGKGDEQREVEIEATFVLKKDTDEAFLHSPISLDSLQGMIILMHDVTDLHRLQHLANRNDRMKILGEMASMVAHEIRNPLGGIKGFASLLQRDLSDQPHLQQLAGHIETGVDNLNRLVTNILKYARPLQVSLESVNLVLLLQQLCQQVKADESLATAVQLEVIAAEESLIASVDPGLIRSAVLNLVVNAIQSLPEKGGRVTISLNREGGCIIVHVQDTGSGITPENLKKIFSPFFTTKPSGNGFGLAEVDQVIKAHGGKVEVASIVGQGTTFTIKVPNLGG